MELWNHGGGFSLDATVPIAVLVPPPRQHRHRYYGVLAPNAPLRAPLLPWSPRP